MTPPPMQVEDREEEVSNEILDDSELGPLSISKLEVNSKNNLFMRLITNLGTWYQCSGCEKTT